MSRMLTLMRRISASWVNGTPQGGDAYGLTDLFVSPEVKEMIRGFAYNPMNVISGPDGSSNGVVALPDAVREDIFRAAGTQELWGVRITDLLELGTTQKYNVLFKTLADADGTLAISKIAHSEAAFNSSSHQMLIGLDASRDAFIRPVAQQMETGGTFTVLPDDQFVARADKTGFYGFLEEGRVCIDGKAICGLVV